MAEKVDALEAWPTRKILDARTRKPVGAEYVWNDGERAVRWFDGAVDNVVYDELGRAPTKPSV